MVSGLLRSTHGERAQAPPLVPDGVHAPVDSRDRAAEMSSDLTQAVAMPDVRRRDPLTIVDRAHELRECRSRRPHDRPRELGIPRHTRKPLDNEDIVASNKWMTRRRRLLERLNHQPIPTQRLLPPVGEAGEQLVDRDDPCRGSTNSGVVARPAPLLRPATEPGANRIPDHVTNRAPQMRVRLHHNRLVATLKQMPHPPMTPVEPLRVHPVQLPHPPRQHRLQRHHKQMEVVPHQAVGEHPPPIPDSHLAEDLEEPLPIPIIPKYQGTLVPARDDMEDTTSQLDPRRTHHHQNLAPEQTTIEGCGQIVTNPAQDAEETGGWNEEDLTPLSLSLNRHEDSGGELTGARNGQVLRRV